MISVKTREKKMESIDTFLVEFAKTIKAVSFYPEGHPALVNTLQRIASQINSFAQNEPITFEITKEAITTKNSRVSVIQPIMRDFVQTLILRRVNRIIFHKGIDADELYAFLQLLTMEAGNIFSAGGMEVLLEGSGIKNIALSETQLKRNISKAKEEVKETLITGNEVFDMNLFAPKDDMSIKHIENTFVKESIEEKKISIEDTCKKLKLNLIEAKETNDAPKYIGLLKELANFLNNLDWAIYYKLVLDFFELLIYHYFDEKTLPGVKKEIKSFINERFNEKRLSLLIDLYLSNNDNKFFADKFIKIFNFIGEQAVEAFLNYLSTANDIKTRKKIINELTQMGDVAFNRVIFHLTDDRWYIVRNMVTILGIFGKKEALPYLFDVSKHSDSRVRKEVVKSLARIQDPKGFAFLREMLTYESEDVKKLIIFSLGIMKDVNSIKSIVSILENDSSISLKKEALVALGRISHYSVIPILKKYSQKKTFFNKAENKILRLAAIDGLSEIRHEESIKTLEKLIKDGDVDIRDAAFEALQKLKLNVEV